MDFSLSEEQQLLKDSITAFVDKDYHFDVELCWKYLILEIGLIMLFINWQNNIVMSVWQDDWARKALNFFTF